MQNFVAQQMRRFGLAPKNKKYELNPLFARERWKCTTCHMEIDGRWVILLYNIHDIQSRSDLGHYIALY